MMDLLAKIRVRSAAKRYASRLGQSLARSFGGSSTYTPRQIQRGVADCALDPKYIVFAYAAFLPKAEFEVRLSEMPIKLPYLEARDLYLRYVPAKRGPIIRDVHEICDGAGGGEAAGIGDGGGD